jgi:hypothetical protein
MDWYFAIVPLLCIGGLLAMFTVGFFVITPPPDRLCTNGRTYGVNCSGFMDRFLDGTDIYFGRVSYYAINVQQNDVLGLPKECYATNVTTKAIDATGKPVTTWAWVSNDKLADGPGVMFQPYDITYDAVDPVTNTTMTYTKSSHDICAIKRTLYAVLWGTVPGGSVALNGDKKGRNFVPLLFGLGMVPVFVNIVFIYLALSARTRKNILDIVFISATLAMVASMAVSASASSLFAILFAFFGVVAIAYYLLIRGKLRDYGDMVLDTVGMVMQMHFLEFVPVLLFTCILPILLLFAFVLLYARVNERWGGGFDAGLFFITLFLMVLPRNMLAVASSQLSGMWYFKLLKTDDEDAGQARGAASTSKRKKYLEDEDEEDEDVPPSFPLCKALVLCWFNRLGSISLGSLISSIAKALSVAAGFMRTQVSARMQIIASLALVCETLLRPFSALGYSYIPFYNQGFIRASLTASTTVRDTSLSLIMIEDVLGAACWFSGLVVGAATLGTAYFANLTLLKDEHLTSDTLLIPLYIPAFLAGYVAAISVLDAIEAMANCIYIAFAEDPVQLQDTDPGMYLDMFESWQLAIEDQQLLLEEGANWGVNRQDDDTLSRSSDGVAAESDLDENDLEQYPNERMRKARKALANPANAALRGGGQSLFRAPERDNTAGGDNKTRYMGSNIPAGQTRR